MTDRESDKLWSVLDRIQEDPAEAKHAGWTKYVSSRSVWASAIPGTSYYVYWAVDEQGVVTVAHLMRDMGV